MLKKAAISAFLGSTILAPSFGAGKDMIAAQQASTAPASAITPSVAQPPRYSPEILSALKHLSALLSKGSLVDQKELDNVAGEISKLDDRITGLLGPDIIRELEEREKELLSTTRIAAAKAELLHMRSLLIAYYGDTEGKYPETPAALVPKYISTVPELELPWHAKTGALTLAREAGHDQEKAVTDTGGWLYFTDPASADFGMLILNCSHKDDKGVELFKY